MKYLKKFEGHNHKVLENVNSHYPGEYDTELKHCFDGFEELNLHCQELTGQYSNINGGSILISRRHEKFTAVPFTIDDDIIEELESSIGKATELGFTIDFIHLSEVTIQALRPFKYDLSDIKKSIGSKVNNIMVFMNKPTSKVLENKTYGDLEMCFDGFLEYKFPKISIDIIKARDNGRNRRQGELLDGRSIGIRIHSKYERNDGPNEILINSDIKNELKSSIGKASELGFKVNEIFIPIKYYSFSSVIQKNGKLKPDISRIPNVECKNIYIYFDII